MLNHAFLIMVHKQPELFGRIVHELAAKNHYFFVHIDLKNQDFPEFVDSVRNVQSMTFIPRMSMYHGKVSQIYCELALFRDTCSYPVRMDYFHLISGQDYPLRSNEIFNNFFERHDGIW